MKTKVFKFCHKLASFGRVKPPAGHDAGPLPLFGRLLRLCNAPLEYTIDSHVVAFGVGSCLSQFCCVRHDYPFFFLGWLEP